jgi:NAD dependent epimerase/dehydratase family enzyme
MTMSPDPGGIFAALLHLVRFGLGGTAGSGEQFVSWIHGVDFIRSIEFLIAHEELNGPINLAAPGPVPYREFMPALRQAWGTPVGLPALRRMLELGVWFLRTEAELILKSRRVVPGDCWAPALIFISQPGPKRRAISWNAGDRPGIGVTISCGYEAEIISPPWLEVLLS